MNLDDAAVARLAAGIGGRVLGVEPEGEGWDHRAWRVETVDGPWIVRAGKEEDHPGELAADVRHEVAVMQLVRRRLGGWAAAAVVLDEPSGCLAHPRVPGVPLQDLLVAGAVAPSTVTAIAGQVGALIRAIGTLDPADAGVGVDRDDAGPAAWVAGLPAHLAAIDHLLTGDVRVAIERFLAAPPPDDADLLVLQHNDLGAEHVIVDDGCSITGIIDWSDAAITDPAADVGRLLRDLGAGALPHVLDGYGATGAERAEMAARAWCYARCLIVEDLAYALGHQPDLVAFELANLDRLFRSVR